MSLRERLTRAYFNSVYNPLYDASTARLPRYAEAQEKLVRSLHVEPSQRILCAGLGTGNELTVLRAHEPTLDLVGIDLSRTALQKARRKPAGRTSGSALLLMDAQLLAFSGAVFDRVLCYHVLDFASQASLVVEECLRVLKPGGRFVISFPSGSEGPGLGAALLTHGFKLSGQPLGERVGRIARSLLAGCIYLPLTLRRRPTVYTPDEVDSLLRSQGAADVVIESDPVYRDHIASGAKEKGRRSNAS